ncbi:MAG: ATP-binding protein [Ekhidna sp.]|uniref:tetratricopeptide repeat-containing sensor histidine kinase n=1 Tax=Ekhidna sp. TaxID=2608089 RepID=UPI003298DA17
MCAILKDILDYRMIRVVSLIIILFSCSFSSSAQVPADQLSLIKKKFSESNHDSTKLRLSTAIATGYRFSNIDSSLHYYNTALAIAEKLNSTNQKAYLLSLIGAVFLENGKLPESLAYQFEALRIGEELRDTVVTSNALNRIGNVYMELADYRRAIEYYELSKAQFWATGDTGMYHNEISNIGNIYSLMNQPDSALYYQKIVYKASLSATDRYDYTFTEIMFRYGNAFKLKQSLDSALFYYQRAIQEAQFDNDLRNLAMSYYSIAELYLELQMTDSALNYAQNAILTAEKISFKKIIRESALLISSVFKERKNYEDAYSYLIMANEVQEDIAGTKKLQELQQIILDEQERNKEENIQRIANQSRNRQLALLTGSSILVLIGLILFRNNRQKQKANRALKESISKLKSTQTKLIHSEKMASLGELTAGIAHEIQNPLNFVNNFSELNKELVDELKDAVAKNDQEEIQAILDDLHENETKIAHHGKRAEEIVKSMLQHSRTGNDEKELTDINQLADEYLRLAYHGLRAKDKSFNADFKTELDPSLPTINIIPQDIGRVLLNLINNAFQAVRETEKPIVTVSTKYLPLTPSKGGIIADDDSPKGIQITISDNGIGIPDNIRDKIFQPFFTTKNAGEGTGLGLSMSHEIITKGHGGTLEVESEEGKGTSFIFKLPITK